MVLTFRNTTGPITIGNISVILPVSQTPAIISSITYNNGVATSTYSGSITTGNGIIAGTSTTNDTTYNVYAFGNSNTLGSNSKNYNITYTSNQASYIYALAVGGGGGGGCYVGSGGGAGGVVMMPILLPSGNNQTITISVGSGGLATIIPTSGTVNQLPTNGVNTTILFSAATTPSSITALGGDFGATQTSTFQPGSEIAGIGGASSGGGLGHTSGWLVTTQVNGVALGKNPAPANNSYYNFGNMGGTGYVTSTGTCGGGGGAGTAGGVANGNGGSGIKCILPGISNFTPSGYSAFNTYYWGGGGAGGIGGGTPGTPGIGGGGGGNYVTLGAGSSASTGGINNSSAATGYNATPGGANTGGGGGGYWASNGSNYTTSGAGGSGIVVLAFPTSVQTILPINNNFTLPAQTTNSASTSNTTPTNWTVTGSGTYYILNGTGGSSWNFNYCPYVQYFFTSTTTTVTLSQSVNLTAKTYTLSFCSAVNSTYASGQFTAAVGGTTYFTSTLTTSNTAWNIYSCNFTIASTGSYALTFTFNCPVGISQVLIY